MEKKKTILVDEHLQAFTGMQEAGTDDFFFTRLKARMERERPAAGFRFPLHPAWILGSLVLFLAINSFMLLQEFKTNKKNDTADLSSLQRFAASYDQSLSTSY